MLRHWKDSWKGRTQPRDSPNEDDSILGADAQSGLTSGPAGLTMPGRAAAIPPADALHAPASAAPPLGELENADGSRPAKRRKLSLTEETEYAAGSISQRLPEIHGNVAEPFARSHKLPLSDDIHLILDQAKRENTIGALLTQRASYELISKFAEWTFQRSDEPILLIVESTPRVKSSASSLRSSGIVVEENLSPSNRRALTSGAVHIIEVTVLLDSLDRHLLSLSDCQAIVIDAFKEQEQSTHTFLMTASKVMEYYSFAQTHSPRLLVLVHSSYLPFEKNMFDVEAVFKSKIARFSSHQPTEPPLYAPKGPSEVVITYGPSPAINDTKLIAELKLLDPSEKILRRHFKASRRALSEVGLCAADLVWRRAQQAIERAINGTPSHPGQNNHGKSSISGTHTADQQSKCLQTIKNWNYTMPNLDASSQGFNVTPKLLKLVELLKACQPYGEAFRGIVFVHKRAIAYVIVDMLRSLGEEFPFLRPCVSVRNRAADSQPQTLLRQFSTGTYNLIVATKSLEDLDVPKASVVIRFDLFHSHVSEAYVRSCALGQESHLIYMVEQDNAAHRRVLSEISQPHPDILRWYKTVSQDPRSSVPPANIYELVDPYLSESEDEELLSEPSVIDPTTSGRIYLQDATAVVYRMASSLVPQTSHDGHFHSRPLFQFTEYSTPDCPGNYICTVTLPPPLMKNIAGLPSPSLAQARRSACFQACTLLAQAGSLDYRLFPFSFSYAFDAGTKSPTALPAPNGPSRSANESNTSPDEQSGSGARTYAQKRPEFWGHCAATRPTDALFPTIITVDLPGSSEYYAPMLLLVRLPLPILSPFKIFFSGSPATVHFQRAAPLAVNQTKLETLHSYTVRLFRAIGNKPYTCAVEDALFFLSPLDSAQGSPPMSGDQWDPPSVEDLIPWASIAVAATAWALPLKDDNENNLDDDMKDAVIQDRWVEFTRRYEVVKLRRDLTPLSKPDDSVREAEYPNLLEYCKARRHGFEGLKKDDQPLIEVSRVPPFLNRLSPTTPSEPAETVKVGAKYLIPELCAKFTIPASTFRTALALPSVLRRVDELLLVKELNARLFNYNVREDLLHMAVSTPSSVIEYDYERLELLGDAFLKYLSSVYVFVSNPTANEGALHFIRQRLISNKSLLQNATRAGLPGYILSKPFVTKFWKPINYQLGQSTSSPDNNSAEGSSSQGPSTGGQPLPEIHPGDLSTLQVSHAPIETKDGAKSQKKRGKKKRQQIGQDTQVLGDKAVADVAEAIIGAAYITGGRETALRAAKTLNVPILNISQWSDFCHKIQAPPLSEAARLPSDSVDAVETIIGHKFIRPQLLAEALTHISIHGKDTTSYERLEFIGDAILDFMVIRYIYDRYQQLSPGGLTLLKGAMVSNSALAAVCVWSGLHKHILLESHNLSTTIETYVNELGALEATEREAAHSEGRPLGQYWLELEPPKALSDVVESIIGAIYLSDDLSPEGTERFFDKVLRPFFDEHITLRTLSHHPTKTLLEVFQAHGCHQFEIFKEKDTTHPHVSVVVHNVILADAQDANASLAARRASITALDALEGDPDFLNKTCDCRTNSVEAKKRKMAMEDMLAGLGEEGAGGDAMMAVDP
ncbi:hypothetical protein EYR40_005379 [Pleurotus pulmonarius]|nr:hypothetical protein EYR40_005379 [Pleurotus pulmonarius]